MVFKAKLVALLSLEGGWKHVMTMISHLLLQAFRCNTKRCLGLCSIVSGGGVGVSTATAVCATRTEMRRMDGQVDLLRMSQRISVSCTPPPPCATSLETRLTEGCLLHSSLTSTAAQSFSFSETLETSLWRQNSKTHNGLIVTAPVHHVKLVKRCFQQRCVFLSHRHTGPEASEDSNTWGRFVHFACLVI